MKMKCYKCYGVEQAVLESPDKVLQMPQKHLLLKQPAHFSKAIQFWASCNGYIFIQISPLD